ncbi:MAG: hypothetical protein IT583_07145, partial [Verrucomicrobia bacterium]|nr:hypothetical protein [Verrucomicrobiota bacterium]
ESFGSTTLTYTIPAAKMTGGAHVVKIVVDAGSQIAETDESASGNSVSSNFTIVTPDSSPNRLIFSIFSR